MLKTVKCISLYLLIDKKVKKNLASTYSFQNYNLIAFLPEISLKVSLH